VYGFGEGCSKRDSIAPQLLTLITFEGLKIAVMYTMSNASASGVCKNLRRYFSSQARIPNQVNAGEPVETGSPIPEGSIAMV
jgi:hypothetical protein